MASKLKVVAVIVAAVAAGIVAVWKLAPDRRPAAQQIVDNLVEIQKAVQEKSLSGVMGHVSESYRDPEVENKRELTQLAVSGFREPGDFQMVLQPERPEVEGDQATVTVRVDFAVTRGQAIGRAAPFTLQTRWAKEKGHWRIISATGYWDASGAFDEGGL